MEESGGRWLAMILFAILAAVGIGIWRDKGVNVGAKEPPRQFPEPPAPPPLPEAKTVAIAPPTTPDIPGRTKKPRPNPEDLPKIAKPEIKGVPAKNETPWIELKVPAVPKETPELLARGKDLYAKACAYCHGDDGKALAPGTLESSTTVKDLTDPLRFVARSSELGTVPFDEDLYRTYYRGMPGTDMASFQELPPGDLWALVGYTKSFSPTYKEPVRAPRLAYVPERAPKDWEPLLQQGDKLYRDLDCVRCHGNEGVGGTMPMSDLDGMPFATTNFVRDGGALICGPAPLDIARTYLIGMVETPMESYRERLYGTKEDPRRLAPSRREDGDRKLWALVGYTIKMMKK